MVGKGRNVVHIIGTLSALVVILLTAWTHRFLFFSIKIQGALVQ